jgi:hypothetical protein
MYILIEMNGWALDSCAYVWEKCGSQQFVVDVVNLSNYFFLCKFKILVIVAVGVAPSVETHVQLS